MNKQLTRKFRWQRAERFKLRRIQLGLTQGELAEKLGYESPQYISNYERAECDPPSDKLPELASILGIRKDEVIGSFVSEIKAQLEYAFGKK